MDSSQDDEDNRTLGLPPGALVKILHQDGEKGKPKDRERPAAGPSDKPTSEKPGAWSQLPLRKPPSSLAPAPPRREPVDDTGSDFRTLTPAGFGRNRREIPGLDVLRENQGLSSPPMVPSTKPNAPQDRQAPGPAQGRPPIHTGWPDADTGRSLQSDKWPEPEGFETALLPHQKKPRVPKCRHPRLAGLTSRHQTHGAVRRQPRCAPGEITLPCHEASPSGDQHIDPCALPRRTRGWSRTPGQIFQPTTSFPSPPRRERGDDRCL